MTSEPCGLARGFLRLSLLILEDDGCGNDETMEVVLVAVVSVVRVVPDVPVTADKSVSGALWPSDNPTGSDGWRT